MSTEGHYETVINWILLNVEQIINAFHYVQSFQEVQMLRHTSHPGGTATSWSMSWILIHLVRLRTASILSCGTHQDAVSPCRASGYCCSVHTTTNPTGRSALADTSPLPRATFCWAVTVWCQLHHSACLPTPSRTDRTLWLCIAALTAHRQLHKGGSPPEACWMQLSTDREDQIRRHRSWVKLWRQDSCPSWRIQRFCWVMRPSAAVEAFTPMTCLLFQWVQRVGDSEGQLKFNRNLCFIILEAVILLEMTETYQCGKTKRTNAD